jgi:hypothetical protein
MSAMNVDVATLTLHNIAFTASSGVEPLDSPSDWDAAIVVTLALEPDLYVSSIGDSLAILTGPLRGDAVTTVDLAVGDHQVWVEVKEPASDERIVRTAGIYTIV